MKLASLRWFPALLGLTLATAVVPYAHAGCGQYHPASFNVSPERLAWPQLLQATQEAKDPNAAVADLYRDEHGQPTMVGTWKERWISKGSEGIPDGPEVDAGYAQWHSDHTEMNISGLRAPLTGMSAWEWRKLGEHQYRTNHFGILYDRTGQNLVGIAHIQQWLTLDSEGMATTGRFSIDQYDEAGNLLAYVQGKILGSRVTMDTGFEKLE